jgi:hypothetical protein
MPKIAYVSQRFNKSSRELIDHANQILSEYEADGYVITLRQLYYQFVSRDLLANSLKNYKRLGDVVNNARLAGLIDWSLMEDRTRNLQSLTTWDNPAEVIETYASYFRLDLWATQQYRPEVWIEKEALAGIFERICNELRVPFFCCRGYTSQSEMWSAGQRFLRYRRNAQTPYILHFGDHDPSGIDMTRDIRDRIAMFTKRTIKLERLALNMDQVDQYGPPPNPAKTTDARAEGYIREYGAESWELDALEPRVLGDLVRQSIMAIRDESAWAQSLAEENEHKRLLVEVSDQWDNLTEGL